MTSIIACTLSNKSLNSVFLSIVLVICEFGQRLSNAFDEIHYDIELSDWYLFPCDIQRMLPVILIVAHQPVELKCFGSISAVRENSKKVNFHSLLNYCMICCMIGLFFFLPSDIQWCIFVLQDNASIYQMKITWSEIKSFGLKMLHFAWNKQKHYHYDMISMYLMLMAINSHHLFFGVCIIDLIPSMSNYLTISKTHSRHVTNEDRK